MITLKTNGYTIGDYSQLSRILEHGAEDVIYDCEGCCDGCACQRACVDIAHLIKYVKSKVRNEKE